MAAMRLGMVVVALSLACASALAVAPAVSPEASAAAQVLASADGRRVAFDDSAIDGGHAIRVFDADGKLVRELDLADFLPKHYVGALAHDDGGLKWRRGASLAADKGAVEFSVAVPGADEDALHFSVDLQDGVVRTSEIREYLAAADAARAKVGAGS